jgi:hypothetical protein
VENRVLSQRVFIPSEIAEDIALIGTMFLIDAGDTGRWD